MNTPFRQTPEACQILFQVATFLKRGTSRPLGRGNHLGFTRLFKENKVLINSVEENRSLCSHIFHRMGCYLSVLDLE